MPAYRICVDARKWRKSYFNRFTVFVWTAENYSNTPSVYTIFSKTKKKSPFSKISGYVWRGPQIPGIECDAFTGMLQMNPPFMSKTSALHEHHACLYFASSFTARLRRKTSVCDVLCRAPNPPQWIIIFGLGYSHYELKSKKIRRLMLN